MKSIAWILLFSCCINLSKAQEINEFVQANSKAYKLSGLPVDSTKDVADFIKLHYDNDQNKVRAIYAWVTANLKYDTDSARIINSGIDAHAKINVALKRRKGVCENFAAIFNDICIKAGLSSLVIDGYTRQLGRVDNMGHSWCAVSVNKKWYLFDPTWDVGSAMNSKFFMIDPAEFIESHMPFDPLWQFLPYPVTHEQFYRGNTFQNNRNDYFNFSDSVAAYIAMDSLQQWQSSALRIQKYGLINTRVKENYDVVKMNIEMHHQDKELKWYNSSVDDLNEATAILNKFIAYRNNQFVPPKPDWELRTLLDGIDSKMESSVKKLDEVDKSEARLVLGTESTRERVRSLLNKIQEQKDFLKRYIHTLQTERQSLFVGTD